MDSIVYKKNPNTIEQAEINKVNSLLDQQILTLYHGTKNADLSPSFNYNNYENDYGKGFYTTTDSELGKEWAYSSYTKGDKGYLFEYTIDISELSVLNLVSMDTMHWLAELLSNRKLNLEGKEATADTVKQLIDKYKINTSEYDLIIGYRADDSYFVYAEDFVSGAIYRDTFERAIRNGDLGIQVFVKSERAFGLLTLKNGPIEVPEKYKQYYDKRDNAARNKYFADIKKQDARVKQRIYDFL